MVRGQTQGEATKGTLGLPAGGEGHQPVTKPGLVEGQWAKRHVCLNGYAGGRQVAGKPLFTQPSLPHSSAKLLADTQLWNGQRFFNLGHFLWHWGKEAAFETTVPT